MTERMEARDGMGLRPKAHPSSIPFYTMGPPVHVPKERQMRADRDEIWM